MLIGNRKEFQKVMFRALAIRSDEPQGRERFCENTVGWFSNRTGTSVDDGVRKSNNWLDQWQSGKFSTGSRV